MVLISLIFMCYICIKNYVLVELEFVDLYVDKILEFVGLYVDKILI